MIKQSPYSSVFYQSKQNTSVCSWLMFAFEWTVTVLPPHSRVPLVFMIFTRTSSPSNFPQPIPFQSHPVNTRALTHVHTLNNVHKRGCTPLLPGVSGLSFMQPVYVPPVFASYPRLSTYFLPVQFTDMYSSNRRMSSVLGIHHLEPAGPTLTPTELPQINHVHACASCIVCLMCTYLPSSVQYRQLPIQMRQCYFVFSLGSHFFTLLQMVLIPKFD